MDEATPGVVEELAATASRIEALLSRVVGHVRCLRKVNVNVKVQVKVGGASSHARAK